MSKIAVDVTPLLPGGINGGAKPMVVALLQELPQLLTQDEFILWTADYNHEELAFLDKPNLQRQCVHYTVEAGLGNNATGFKKLVGTLRTFAGRRMPSQLKRWLRRMYYRTRSSQIDMPPIKQQNIDFLLCPFSSTPILYDPTVPTLSVIYDLQFLDYPEFFTENERFYRGMHFNQICQTADHIATISEFTRQSVLANSHLQPEQITTIHIGLVHDYSNANNPDEMGQLFSQLGIKTGRYLFFPANFWAHKNHKALLSGFHSFKQSHPKSDLKIVCTGALDNRRAALLSEVEQLGLSQYVILPGFLPDHEIGFLYQCARGLIFPSLYEGFGIPLLEAMQAGIPIACSNVTSLPEIGGDAVLYFNPKNTAEISQAIEALEFDEPLRKKLIQKGHERLRFFNDARGMAQNYKILICSLLESKKQIHSYGLHGLTEDQWFLENAYVSIPASDQERVLEISFHVPIWRPGQLQCILQEINVSLTTYNHQPGDTFHKTLKLPSNACVIQMSFSPVFSPAQLGVSNDHRQLSVLCELFQIRSTEGSLLFAPLKKQPQTIS